MRDETQKNAAAIAAASKRKAEPPEECELFKAFLASEAKYIQGLADNGTICGVPPQAIERLQEGHDKGAQFGRRVCEKAQTWRPAGVDRPFIFDGIILRRDPWEPRARAVPAD
jgi:hypothetical protein